MKLSLFIELLYETEGFHMCPIINSMVETKLYQFSSKKYITVLEKIAYLFSGPSIDQAAHFEKLQQHTD